MEMVSKKGTTNVTKDTLIDLRCALADIDLVLRNVEEIRALLASAEANATMADTAQACADIADASTTLTSTLRLAKGIQKEYLFSLKRALDLRIPLTAA